MADDMPNELSPEMIREMGKAYFFGHDGDIEKKKQGLHLIIEAQLKKDPEATYIVARLLLDGVLKSSAKDPLKSALELMCFAANTGCIQARAYLNAYCENRYSKEFGTLQTEVAQDSELVDFNGRPIRINRQGVFTPIDAVLEYKGGQNVLTLSTNVIFLYSKDMEAGEHFEQAVLSGLQAWQGEYEVFGGQKLTVKVDITNEDKLFDNLLIMPVTDEISSAIQSVSNVIGTKEGKAQVADLIASKRSFALSGLKWSVNSRKIIYIQSKDGKFDDYEEIMHVAKHEFGHALGLGDLYASDTDNLKGVEKGTYTELDSYAISNKFYNLVMCDHHGPVSNNDIEMVILAFRENKQQLFQPSRIKGRISTALGKGN